MKIINFLAALTLTNAVAFAQVTNPDLPNPELLTKKYLEEISGRKLGQSKFAHKSMDHFGGPRTMSRAESAPGGDAAREIQESDVFKLGKKGNKELFLLNQYRGFQVVSFEDGLERPKLIGRFPVFNNYSSEMYYLEAQNKVLIINTEWSYAKNRWATNHTTKVYMMDVSDSSAPKLVKEIAVPGYLSESRMVGDVLYTITTSGDYNNQKAQITSVKIDDASVEMIEQQELHGKDNWVSTMNVLKDGEKFYVVSTLTNWATQGDSVNVHDITSPRGDIQKVFTAKARGRVTERSNTFIHKGHLFAVSNYRADENGLTRVSVEAFPLKASAEPVVSGANMRVSVGDTNGQHASLQDVRVSGDMLYAFWVPANNIDPFELFDISEPSKGIKHLGQLQFEGWISKAFPMEFNEKKYVLGLGEIVPVTSETGKRYPQAKLFEIKKVGTGYKHEVVASLTIDSDDVWSRLNSEDKYFEMVLEAPGVYNILFPVTFTKNWKGGAKIVSLNLNTGSITEGASVTGEDGWLKRVFLNKEVRALNTFSDTSLETFKQEDMASQGFVKSVSILELARDIVDFQLLSATEGVQIINKTKTVELRKVNLTNSDAEKQQVLSTKSVNGKYEWHSVKNGKIFVVTSFTKKEMQHYGQGQSYEQDVFDHANLTVVDLATQEESVERIDTSVRADDQRFYYYFQIQAITNENTEILKINNEFFKLIGNSLKKLEVENSCQYFFDAKSDSFSLEAVGSEIYAFTAFKVTAIDEAPVRNHYESVEYELPFTKKLSFEGSKVSCSASVNVPGRPVLSRDGQLVTNEFKGNYFFHRGIHFDYYDMRPFPYRQSSSKTFSLKFNGPQEASLVDILDHDITNGLFKDGFITYDSEASKLDLWRVTPEGEFLVKPQYLGLGSESSLITVKSIKNRNFVFMKKGLKVGVFEIDQRQRVTQLKVTSKFDQNAEDGFAEYIFAIQSILPAADFSKFHVSQGMYGMTDINLQ
ncbi:MAG TPA: beta-propeller domain-containing protein [Bacteriovoracaceae bacterium]|nr:beta-propeller domain-containing protein [Bacteriovoracaceae bacterium]